MNSKKTKIVTTIGPATDSKEQMKALIEAGANVFRFNMKHNTVAWHEERIARADEAAAELGTRIGIFIDLQGPEIRIETPNQQPIEVVRGEEIIFRLENQGEEKQVLIPHPEVFSVLTMGDTVLIDDGFLEFKVIKTGENWFIAKADDDYIIKHRKGMNLPGKALEELPSLDAADYEKLDMATRVGVDYVALSFCRNRKDVLILREELNKRNLSHGIIAKIENQESLNNIDEIIDEADVIMVARGDLGVEVPIEQLAYWQKTIVTKCRMAGKPVIVATQMLESMQENPRPTRAEATDVSNAVLDGTDAIMLSGETAFGKYPLQAVKAMAIIAEYNEPKSDCRTPIEAIDNTTQAIVHAVRQILWDDRNLNVAAIVVFTDTGFTARAISALRTDQPVIAVTNDSSVADRLMISYGVTPYETQFPTGEFKLPQEVLNNLSEKNITKPGQLILVVHGQHWNNPSNTNSLALVRV